MTEIVYKIIELVGTGGKSWEDAAYRTRVNVSFKYHG